VVCPVDNQALVIANRGRIEIDFCPSCRGVWLDRGELDKIIEESSYVYGSESRVVREPDSRHYGEQKHHSKKKKENFLGDLFDF
jgi:Zn-finger nucleic acid-binding protein